MCNARLAELLRRFKLPPATSQADLRRAYYKRAKLLHPDIAGEASEADFKRLRQDYEEASTLMGQTGGRGAHTSYGGQQGAGAQTQGFGWEEPSWDTPGGQQWKRSAFGGNSAFAGGGFHESKVDFDPQQFRERQRSHTQRDGQGYTYKAGGRGSAQAPQRAFNPAQVFKGTVLVAGVFFVGKAWIARLRREAVDFQRVYT
ncbi:unnamed protein product [Effrenium voratum]|uniref:J domain-containing protein n=1 Tax=Effrenium voratum TaxID=2562239 RepID=A0AA36HNC1_9DINO|nr:unnamed protein product [Effrenium voratum]CAJ1372335.1 unnamed protein product [Effrenium voratum]